MNGIVAYGVYLPCHRLDRKAIGEALGVPARSEAGRALATEVATRRRALSGGQHAAAQRLLALIAQVMANGGGRQE